MGEQLPSGWTLLPLGKLFKIGKDSIEPSDFPNDEFDYYSIPVFDETGTFARTKGNEISSGKFALTAPTILVSKLNPRKPRVVLVNNFSENKCCSSTEFMAYQKKTTTTEVWLEYYQWYLYSDLFHRRLQLVATGSTNSHVRVSPPETLLWPVHTHHPSPNKKKSPPS